MKQLLVLISAITVSIAGCSQVKTSQKLNLDFESVINGMPADWENFGSAAYMISPDSAVVKNGRYSASIIQKGGADYKAWSYKIPANYDGKSITLSGYIKTDSVTDGYAGLWMRLDPSIAFDNMSSRGVKGTTEWTKYEITLKMDPDKTTAIVVGGLLVGKGKVWIDDLKVTIDGRNVESLKPYVRKALPAENDKEFDKGSAVKFPVLNDELIGSLELLGKVWGFIKYHHPSVAKGSFNMDYELFRILPEYLNANSNATRDKVILQWINKFGSVTPCRKCPETPETASLKPDFTWVENNTISTTLKNKIKEIYLGRHQGKHFQIDMDGGVGNPVFLNEKSYSDMPYPDEGFRLLSLYRYWNMIQYFYPNRQLTDKRWDTLLREYIPKFINAKNELEYELAAVQIIGDLQDSHANLWGGGNKFNESKGDFYPPFHVRFVEDKLVVTDYYNPELKQAAGLQVGDVITQINGRSVEHIIDSIKKYYPASNEAVRLRDISFDILRSRNNETEIKFISGVKENHKKLALYKKESLNYYTWFKQDTGRSYKMLANNIGYITLQSIKEKDIKDIKDAFKDTKGIVIDIRNYPSTFVPFLLGSWLSSSPKPFVKFTIGNKNNPGEFTFTESLKIPGSSNAYKGKVIVLVNEISQSQAEYTTMAFRAGDNTTVIGSTTAGADGNVSSIILPGGLSTMISGIGVYYPDGKNTQRVGIIPDVEVKPTIHGIRSGHDELLEKAIEIIQGNKSNKKAF